MKSDVIILAGGLGTRLKNVLTDTPKPMAPVNNFPFLHYLFKYLKQFNSERIILSVGHLHEQIQNYFGNEYLGLKVIYSIEENPLGTGGAIKLAMKHVISENVFILNGDTYFDVDLNKMEDQHLELKNEITIAVKEMNDFDRYGSVIIEDSKIISFEEKKYLAKGHINAGTYILNHSRFIDQNWPEKFSFEKMFLEKFTDKFHFAPFYSEGYFIDIGIPNDFIKAQNDFKSIFAL